MRKKFTKTDSFFYSQNLTNTQRYLDNSSRGQLKDAFLSITYSRLWSNFWKMLNIFNKINSFDRIKAFKYFKGSGDDAQFLDAVSPPPCSPSKTTQRLEKMYEKLINKPDVIDYNLEILETTSITNSSKNEEFRTPIRTYRPNAIPRKNFKKVIYVHGGGYIINMKNHFFLNGLTLALNAEIQSIDYTLTSEKKLPYSIDECTAVINQLLNREVDRSVTLMGDSAGGHAIFTAAFELAKLKNGNTCRNTCRPVHLPKNVYLLNPWISINQIPESYCLPHSVKCHDHKIKCGWIMYGFKQRDCTNSEIILIAKMQQGLLTKTEIMAGDDENIKNLYKFINDPKISLNERSDGDIELMVKSGINFHFELSDHDGNVDEGEDMYDRFVEIKHLLELEDGTKLCQNLGAVSKRVAVGVKHCWFIFFPGQCRYGVRQPVSWTPEHDEEYDVLMKLIRERL